MRVFGCLLLTLALTACEKKNDGTHTPPATSPGTTPTLATSAAPTSNNPPTARSARPSDPDPDPITHPCVVAIAKFEALLKSAAGTCATDADCHCYPGGMGKLSGCGGVSDKVTTSKLAEIATEYRKDGCSPTVLCAPRLCQPRCDDGKCR